MFFGGAMPIYSARLSSMFGVEDKRSGVVVVTGSSSGIGRACALLLDRLGFTVFAGVRKKDGEDLTAESSGRLTPLVLDVENAGSIKSAAKLVRSSLPRGAGIWGLVNNAGIAVTGPLELLSPAELRRQFEVNVVGALATTQAFVPLIRREGGRVVNVGSINGRIATPFIGPYCASKSALAALNDALRVELKPSGIRVVLVEPGSIKTPIWEKYGAYARRLASDMPVAARRLYGPSVDAAREAAERRAASGAPPQIVARAVTRALSSRRPKNRYVVGLDAKAGVLLDKFVPAWLLDEAIIRYMRLPRENA